MEINNLLASNKTWADKTRSQKSDYFTQLAQGQQPTTLYFGCSDSRVAPEKILDAHLGEIFVHRNIANVLKKEDQSFVSVLYYATQYLNVRHIVVCGHYGCGGIEAALSGDDFGVLNPWLEKIKEVHKSHSSEIDQLNGKKKVDKLVELNVLDQCKTIKNFDFISKLIEADGLVVYPLVFDMSTGYLKKL